MKSLSTMDQKEVAMHRDDKEVMPLDYSDKQAVVSAEKEVVQDHSDKEVISTDEKEVALNPNDAFSRLPIIQTLDIFRINNTETEIRDHMTGSPTLKVQREVKKNLIRSNEHHITISKPNQTTPVAVAKILVKTGECQIKSSPALSWQSIQAHETSHTFFTGSRQLAWEPASVGVDFGQFKLVDAKAQQPLALWRSASSTKDQIARIEYFDAIEGTETEALGLAVIFGLQESMKIAGERDDDYGGGSRKFNGVDPGNSMGMGGVGGGGMM